MVHLPSNALLLLIDVQKAFDHPRWGPRNNPQAEQQIARLLTQWRATARPVMHVQHTSRTPTSVFYPGTEGHQFKDEVQPLAGEPVLQKQVNSCFIGTSLEAQLREQGIETLVIVGLTTPHCVSTTTRMAGNLGFQAYLVGDATAAFDLTGPDGTRYPAETVHALSLATLHDEFATVVSTAEVLEAVAQPV